MTDIIADVDKATEGMGDAQKTAALMTTFTADSIKVWEFYAIPVQTV